MDAGPLIEEVSVRNINGKDFLSEICLQWNHKSKLDVSTSFDFDVGLRNPFYFILRHLYVMVYKKKQCVHHHVVALNIHCDVINNIINTKTDFVVCVIYNFFFAV